MVYRDHFIAAKICAILRNIRDTAQRLALVKGLNDAEAHALARTGKVIVHIDGGLHATEVAGGAAHHPARLQPGERERRPRSTHILDNVILLLWFSINPDGQNMVATGIAESGHAV